MKRRKYQGRRKMTMKAGRGRKINKNRSNRDSNVRERDLKEIEKDSKTSKGDTEMTTMTVGDKTTRKGKTNVRK